MLVSFGRRCKLSRMKSFILFALLSTVTLAQSGDVCCVMSKISGDSVDVRATTMSSSDCKSGGKSGDYKICRGQSDPNNVCSSSTMQSMCETCGYHWSGKVCMTEDPVKKAKKELKEEEKKEQGKKTDKSKGGAAKSSDAHPTPKPTTPPETFLPENAEPAPPPVD
jgi:hypothetical protein